MDFVLSSLPLNAALFGQPPWDLPPRLPSRELPDSAEIVIVGAGLTGLSAALELKSRGHQVLVLDRRIGEGATARSGGLVLGETFAGPDLDFDDCANDLRLSIAKLGIDCDFRWAGCLELVRDDRLPPRPVDWQDHGPLRVRGRVDGGGVNPVKLQTGLLEAAHRAG